MGGEHTAPGPTIDLNNGSSPRGRGTQHAIAPEFPVSRVIPAWAGNTFPDTSSSAGHPRVGGEHFRRCAGHPRVGGEHFRRATYAQPIDGSSPRGRGTRQRCLDRIERDRVIPAWAGNTSRMSRKVNRIYGSSPRGRGTPWDMQPRRGRTRVIPAWAGNTWRDTVGSFSGAGHPRVGGEHSARCALTPWVSGSSPRGRGTPPDPGFPPPYVRVIPAWAGNTSPVRSSDLTTTGHPRVGGEHLPLKEGHLIVVQPGSSPRGRGTLEVDVCAASVRTRPGHPRVGGEHLWRLILLNEGPGWRVIPAWAGNTWRWTTTRTDP